MMNKTARVHQNVLFVDNKQICFPHHIDTVIVMESQAIVLRNIPNHCDKIDNIYSIGLDAKIQWRIQNKSALCKHREAPFAGMHVKDDRIIANDFYGIRYIIDPKSGYITGRDPETNGRYW